MTSSNKNIVIEVKDVEVTYNVGKDNEVQSLKKTNLKIYKNEYIVLFGPSGCGKSTLLNAIAGLQHPNKGSVIIDSREIYKLKKKEMVEFHRSKIGMVFQAFYLIPSLNVIDNVCLPKTAAGTPQKERCEMAMKLLKRFGIDAQFKKMPSELSGGQKQRVSIARALITDADIILADEPVGNLDSVSSQTVMRLLKELNEKDKKTIILVTHDPSHLRYGDRIIHVKDGTITKEEIVKDKASPDDPKQENSSEKNGEIKIKEIIQPELRMLMRIFKNLNSSQVGNLLVPFKAQQLLSHILLSMTNEQIEKSKKILEEFIYKNYDLNQVRDNLDKDTKKDGAGWDKRNADKFHKELLFISNAAQLISKEEANDASSKLVILLINKFKLKLNKQQKNILKNLLLLRISNKIGFAEVRQAIDLPTKEKGLGLDKRTADKIAQKIEIIFLMKYGN